MESNALSVRSRAFLFLTLVPRAHLFFLLFGWHENVGHFGQYTAFNWSTQDGNLIKELIQVHEIAPLLLKQSVFENVWCIFQCHRSPSSNIIVCCNRLLTQFRIQKEQKIIAINYVNERRRKNTERRNEKKKKTRQIECMPAKRKSIQFHRNRRTINQKSISSKAFRIAHLSDSFARIVDWIKRRIQRLAVAKESNGMKEYDRSKQERKKCVSAICKTVCVTQPTTPNNAF